MWRHANCTFKRLFLQYNYTQLMFVISVHLDGYASEDSSVNPRQPSHRDAWNRRDYYPPQHQSNQPLRAGGMPSSNLPQPLRAAHPLDNSQVVREAPQNFAPPIRAEQQPSGRGLSNVQVDAGHGEQRPQTPSDFRSGRDQPEREAGGRGIVHYNKQHT